MRRFYFGVLALVAAGCGGADSSSDGGTGSTNVFVPVVSDFDNYDSWTSFAFDSDGTSDGLTHLSGHRVVYINHTPPHGSSAFPVGTIIVKEINPGLAIEQIFAMAKRGGNYNSGSGGAPGWEWFELQLGQPANAPMLKWQGTAPPAGENYTGSPDGTCNDCHGVDTANDSVLADPLLLSNF